MKRDPRLVGLSREHHHALTLSVRLRKAAQDGTADALVAAARDLVRTFYIDLAPHFQVEEELLLPALEAQGATGRGLAARAREDHAWLRRGAALAAAGQTRHLAAYAERMAAHVRFEERELFEHAQATLDDAVLQQIGQARPA
ncbi:MAG: hemerythrin domain-containing protein [Ottowia sp.]|nr:hemerythrin domain-containing protein [Ottowia sp.]